MNNNDYNLYLMEEQDLERLEHLSSRLSGGTDNERDAGHLLMLILEDVRHSPIKANLVLGESS